MPALNERQKGIINALRSQKRRRRRKATSQAQTLSGAVATKIWTATIGVVTNV
jgi:hypothetical protein